MNWIKAIYKTWLKIAHLIGWINTRILLILFFYLIVAPIGLLTRLIGRDLLELKIDKDKDSYWIKRQLKAFDLKQYKKQF